MRQERTIRIFISSTFKDMHAERDYLVRFVFPELRERCLKKGLHLVDVDLRWGVTEEEAETGKVLEICLDEIENCRPFFIGLLGERYGWIPEQYDVPDHQRYDWLKGFDAGHSVTAIEIYHGVLNNPDMQPRAFFYFRDPAFSTDVPDNKRPEVQAESPAAQEKLAALKNEILRVSTHVMENYPCRYQGIRVNWTQAKADLGGLLSLEDMDVLEEISRTGHLIDNSQYALLNESQKSAIDRYGVIYLNDLETLGQSVLDNLWQAIEHEYPDTDIEEDPLIIEDGYHTRFLDQRIRFFVGQEDILAQIKDYLNNKTVATPLVIAGEAGGGKSALMAMAARNFKETHPDDLLITRFVGASPSSLEIDRLLLNVIETISRHFDLPFDAKTLENIEKINEAFRLTLNMAARKGRVILFIDALNQLTPTFNAHSLNWLPKWLPENVRIIVSILPGEPLGAANKAGLPIIDLPSLPVDNRRSLVTGLLQEYRKTLGLDKQRNTDQMALLLDKENADLPLYLTVACEELRVYPRFEEITDRIKQMPDTTPDLFDQVLSRLEEDHGKQLVADALCLIACSRYGLLESELLELLKRDNEDRLPVNIWAKLSRSVSAYLRNAGDNREGLIGFFHQQLLVAVENRYLSDDQVRKSYYRMLAEYGLKKYHKKSGDKTNTVIYTGIYLYQFGNELRLYELMKDIFNLPDQSYHIYNVIADSLFNWVAYSRALNGEIIVTQVAEKLTGNVSSKNYPKFLHDKGKLFHNTGISHWGLFCYATTRQVLEGLCSQEPDRTDLRNDLSVSYNSVGNMYKAMGDGGKALESFKKSLNIMEDLVVKEPERTNLRRNLSGSYDSIGKMYQNMGDGGKALKFFKKSLSIMEDLVVKEPDRTDFRSVLSGSYKSVGSMYKYMGDGGKALEFFKKSLSIMEDLVVKEPNRTDLKYDLSASYYNVGNMFKVMGDSGKALEFFKKSLSIMEDLVVKEPDRTDFRRDLSVSYNSVGKMYEAIGDSGKALEFFKKSLNIMEDLVVKEPKRTDLKGGLSSSYDNIGNMYKVMNDSGKALEFFKKSLSIMEQLVIVEPDRIDFKCNLTVSYNDFGIIHETMGNGTKALEFFKKFKKIMEELVVKEPSNTHFRVGLTRSYEHVGRMYEAMGDKMKAFELYQKSMNIIEELLVKEPDRTDFKNDLSACYNTIGKMYKATGDGGKALEFFKKGMNIREDLVAKESDRTDLRLGLSDSYTIIGGMYMSIGDRISALEIFQKGMKNSEELISKEPNRMDFKRKMAGSYNNLGIIYESIGNRTNALVFWKKAINIMEEHVDDKSGRLDFKRDLSTIYNSMGGTYNDMGDRTKALVFFEKAIDIRTELVAKESYKTESMRNLSVSYSHVGNIYNAMGDGTKALAFYEKSIIIMEGLVTIEPFRTDFRRELSIHYDNVGKSYKVMGDGGKALELFKKSINIMKGLLDKEQDKTDLKHDLSAKYYRIGNMYMSMGDGVKAIEFLKKSLITMKELVVEEPDRTDFKNDLSVCYNTIGKMYKATGDGGKALEFFKKGMNIREDLVAKEPARVDFLIEYAVSHWNIYEVCQKEEKIIWLTNAKSILQPLVKKGVSNNRLGQIYPLIIRELAIIE